jgi:hypothetical protein
MFKLRKAGVSGVRFVDAGYQQFIELVEKRGVNFRTADDEDGSVDLRELVRRVDDLDASSLPSRVAGQHDIAAFR